MVAHGEYRKPKTQNPKPYHLNPRPCGSNHDGVPTLSNVLFGCSLLFYGCFYIWLGFRVSGVGGAGFTGGLYICVMAVTAKIMVVYWLL